MKKTKFTPEMEQLIAENTALKEANTELMNIADNYDKALTDMTALQRETTDRLNEATEIIKNFMGNDDRIDNI